MTTLLQISASINASRTGEPSQSATSLCVAPVSRSIDQMNQSVSGTSAIAVSLWAHQ